MCEASAFFFRDGKEQMEVWRRDEVDDEVTDASSQR